jgi:chemotaxis receptor (MCP) glutamine deamidase CheD
MQAVSFHSTPRREDPWKGRKVVRLGPGEFAVTSDPDTVLMTVLGSCVAACICDPLAGVGGLNHFMLPESPDGKWGQAAFSLRYGNLRWNVLSMRYSRAAAVAKGWKSRYSEVVASAWIVAALATETRVM